ncbi:MAG: hypothetical protein RIS84_1812, partial [Pseudomonadota bacterium]
PTLQRGNAYNVAPAARLFLYAKSLKLFNDLNINAFYLKQARKTLAAGATK